MVFVSGPYLLTPEFSFLHSFLSVSGFRFFRWRPWRLGGLNRSKFVSDGN